MNRDKLLKKEMKLAEEIFGTESDPDQIPINDESTKKLDALCDGWLETDLDDKGEPASWAVVMPTQRLIAERFLNKKITERELLDLTEPADTYDALYIVSVITVPEHRGKGLASEVIKRAIARMPVNPDALYFAWPTSKEGEGLMRKLKTVFNKEVKLRE